MSPGLLSKLTVGVARLTKLASVWGFVAALATISPTASFAQSATPAAAPPSSGLDVPPSTPPALRR